MTVALQPSPSDHEQKIPSSRIRQRPAAARRRLIAAVAVAALGFLAQETRAQSPVLKVTRVGTNPRSFQILVTGIDYPTDGGRGAVFEMIDGQTGQLLATNRTTLNRSCGISTDACTASTTFTLDQIGSGRYCLNPASTLRFGTFLSLESDAPSRWTPFVFPACP